MNIQYQSTNLQMINSQTNIRQNNLLRLRLLNSQVDEDTKIKTNIKLNNSNSISNAVNVDISTFSLSPTMQAKVRALNETSRSNIETQSKISLYQTANSSLSEVYLTLKRMKELANKSANDTTTDDERRQIQLEIDDLTNEINNIVSNTKFAGQNLLDGSQKASTNGSKGTASADAYTSSSNIRLNLDGSVNTSVSDVIQFTVTGRPSTDEVQIKLETLFGTPSENGNFNVHNSGSSDYENIEGNVTNTEYHYTTNFSGIGSLKLTGNKAIFTSTDGTISSGEIIKNGNLISVEIDNKKIEIDISSNKASLTTSQKTTINDITSGVIIQKDSYYTLLVSGFGSIKFDGINVTFTSTDGVTESFTAVQSGNNFSVNIKGLEIKFNPVSGKAMITQTQTVSTEVISSGVLTNTTNYQSFNFSGVGTVKFNGTDVTFISNDGTVLAGLSAVQSGNTLSVDIKNMKVEFDTSTGKATLSKLKAVNTQVTTSGVVTSSGSYSIIEFEGLGTVKFEGTEVTVIANDGTINNYTAVQSGNLFSINMNNMRIEFNNLTKEAKLIKSEMTTSNVVNSGTLVSNNLIYDASFSGIGSIRIDGNNITFIDTNGIVSQLTAVQSGNILKANIGNMTIQFDKSTNQATLTKPKVDNITTTSSGTVTNTTTSYSFGFSGVGNVKIDGNNITFTDTTGVTSQLTAVQSGNILKANVGNMTIQFDKSTNQATLTKPKVDNVTTTSSGSITNTTTSYNFGFSGIGNVKIDGNNITFTDTTGVTSQLTAVQSGNILKANIGNMTIQFDKSTNQATLTKPKVDNVTTTSSGTVTDTTTSYNFGFSGVGSVKIDGNNITFTDTTGVTSQLTAVQSGNILKANIGNMTIQFDKSTNQATLTKPKVDNVTTTSSGSISNTTTSYSFGFSGIGNVKIDGNNITFTDTTGVTSQLTAVQSGNILKANIGNMTIQFDKSTNQATLTKPKVDNITTTSSGSISNTTTSYSFGFSGVGNVKIDGNNITFTDTTGVTSQLTAVQSGNILKAIIGNMTIQFDKSTNQATLTKPKVDNVTTTSSGSITNSVNYSSFNFAGVGVIKFSGNSVTFNPASGGAVSNYTAVQNGTILSATIGNMKVTFDTSTGNAELIRTDTLDIPKVTTGIVTGSGSTYLANFGSEGIIRFSGTSTMIISVDGLQTYVAQKSGDIFYIDIDDKRIEFNSATKEAKLIRVDSISSDTKITGILNSSGSVNTFNFDNFGSVKFSGNKVAVTNLGGTTSVYTATQTGNILSVNVSGATINFDTVTNKATITQTVAVSGTQAIAGNLNSTQATNTFNFDSFGSVKFSGNKVAVTNSGGTTSIYTATQAGNILSVNVSGATINLDTATNKATITQTVAVSGTQAIAGNLNSTQATNTFNFDNFGSVKFSGNQVTVTNSGGITSIYTATQTGNILSVNVSGATINLDTATNKATITQTAAVSGTQAIVGNLNSTQTTNTFNFDNFGSVKFSGNKVTVTNSGGTTSIYTATQTGNILSVNVSGATINLDTVTNKATITQTVAVSGTQAIAGNLNSTQTTNTFNFDSFGSVKFSGNQVTVTNLGGTTNIYTATQAGNILSVNVSGATINFDTVTNKATITQTVAVSGTQAIVGNLNSTQTTNTFNFDSFGSVKFSGNQVTVTNSGGTTSIYTATQAGNILSVNVSGATINFDTATNKATITQTVAVNGTQTINVNASGIGSYQIFKFDNIGEIKINGTNITFTKSGSSISTTYTATQSGDMISVNINDMTLKFDKSTNSATITKSEQTLVDKIVSGSISNNTSYYTLKFSGLGKFTFNDNTKNVTFISEDGSTVVNRVAVQSGNIFTANINGMEFKFDTVTKNSTITKLEQVQQTEKLSGSLISSGSSNTFNFDGIGSIIFNGKDVTFVPLGSSAPTTYTAIQSGNMFSVNINDMTFKFDSTSKKATVSKFEETEIPVTNNITNINSGSYYEFKFDSIGTVKVSGTNITFIKAGTTAETTYTATQSGNLIKAAIDGMTFKFDISSGIATISRPQQIDVEKITSGSISENSISNTIKFDGIGTVKFSGSHAIFTKEGSNVSTIYAATQSGNLISANIDGMKVTFDIASGKANLKIDTNRTETINTSATQSGNSYSANFDGVGTVKFSGTNVTFIKAGTTTETTYTATQSGNIISVDIGDMTLQLNKASGNITLTKPVDTPVIDRVKGNATTSSDNIRISSGKIYLEFGGVRLTIDNADELKSGDTIILKIYGNEKPYIADSLDGEKAGINSVKPSDLNIVDADGNSLNVTDQNYARMAAEAYDMAMKQVSKEFDKIDAYIKELQGAIDTGTNDGSDGDSGRFEMITGKDKDKITDNSDKLIHIHSYNSTEELVKLLSAI